MTGAPVSPRTWSRSSSSGSTTGGLSVTSIESDLLADLTSLCELLVRALRLGRRDAPTGTVRLCRAPQQLVEDRVVGLEGVRHPRGDVERDLDAGAGGSSCQAEGVVQENLVRSGRARRALQPLAALSEPRSELPLRVRLRRVNSS